MRKPADADSHGEARPSGAPLPKPTPQFRRRAWAEFQRALDPLAPPKPLKDALRGRYTREPGRPDHAF